MTTTPGDNQTPMMRQFYEIKQRYPDKILFYRMGDFYEMFGDDAVLAANVLQIQLTTRNKNKENAIPLCGIPVHAFDQYLNRLTRAGFKVAICEQTEEPSQAKGLVKREVVRIVTPGTVIAPDLLDATTNSFLCAIYRDLKKNQTGISFCDLTTGEFEVDQVTPDRGLGEILELIYIYQPREILLPKSQSEKETLFYKELVAQCRQTSSNSAQKSHFEYLDHFNFDYQNSLRLLHEHFAVSSLAGFGIESLTTAIQTAGATLNYLRETQKDSLAHINGIKRIHRGETMPLDESTIRNLELFQTTDGTSGKFTLIHLLDKCQTSMGSRKLRRWVAAPLRQKSSINRRLNHVESLLNQFPIVEKLRSLFSKIGDLERIASRVSLPNTTIVDMLKLRESVKPLENLKKLFQTLPGEELKEITGDFDSLNDLHQLLDHNFLDDPKLKMKEGGYIRDGVDEKLDRLMELTRNGKQHIANLEAEERKKTGISSLKVKFNRVFGYYIEVTNTSKHLVPDHYIRKQTLVNNERYVTEELKELEESILSAEDESRSLELKLFETVKTTLRGEIARIQTSARRIAEMDVLCAFAHNAKNHNYTRPQLNDNPIRRNIEIKEGRHPVIESLSFEEPFIPNDVALNSDNRFVLVITGPNMGGKSTFMRQTALIALMAQIGSYVPAREAHLPVFDRIFTRVGASDNLTRGQSTFMVEMSEAASILNNATPNSLIILDEIGRGTSTFDGISIAWAIIEFISQLGAITLFATHYHELILLEQRLKGIQNAKVVVREENEEMVFLRKVVAGHTDKSYGIQVARLAGLPTDVIQRAKKVIRELEAAERQFNHLELKEKENPPPANTVNDNVQLSFLQPDQPWVEEIREFDLNNSSPMQAMEFLFQLKRKVG